MVSLFNQTNDRANTSGGRLKKRESGSNQIDLGRIFSQLGHYYPWMSMDYLLDRLSLDQIFMYYDYMVEGLTGKRTGPNKHQPDEDSILKAHPELKTKGAVSK